MKRSFVHKTRLLLTAGALFAFPLAAAAQSGYGYDSNQMANRLNELQNQIQTLSRAVYKGDMSGASQMSGGGGGAEAAAMVETRMSGIEDQQRNLTGQLEKINHDLQQIKDRLDRLQSDNDQRFQQIERAGANNTVAPAPAPMPTPVAPEAAAPAPTPAPAAGGTLGTMGSAATGGSAAEVMYGQAFADVRDSRYVEAEAKFKNFMAQHPGHELTPNAQYWLGETYYVRGDYKQAAKTFAQGYQDYPKSSKAEDSLYKLALSLARLGKTDDACLSLRQMQKVFAESNGPLRQKAQDQIKQMNCP